MSETGKTKKKPLGTGAVVFFSFLCVLLIVAGAAVLLSSLILKRAVQPETLTNAASKVTLSEMNRPDGTSLAHYINETYLIDSAVSDEKMTSILRDGTFNEWIGKKAGAVGAYLSGREAMLEKVSPDEIDALIRENELTIQLHTGINGLYSNNPRILERIKPDIAAWNAQLDDLFLYGTPSKWLHALLSGWIVWVLGGVLLILMVLLVMIHSRGQRHLGTAFKTYAVAAGIPSLLLCLGGLCGEWALGQFGYAGISKVFKALHTIPLTVGGIALLACAALFGFGILWNIVADRPKNVVPAEAVEVSVKETVPDVPALPAETPIAPTVEETVPEEPAAPRHFCRFCGGELVNSDAKFCYKCGKTQ